MGFTKVCWKIRKKSSRENKYKRRNVNKNIYIAHNALFQNIFTNKSSS